MIAFDVTDLPEPDSPTMPSVLPRANVNEMSSTSDWSTAPAATRPTQAPQMPARQV